MKQCPHCNRIEADQTLKFCRADGTPLVDGSSSISSEAGTGPAVASAEIETSILPHTTDASINRTTGPTTVLPQGQAPTTTHELIAPKRRGLVTGLRVAIALALVAVVTVTYFYLTRNQSSAIESIAVLPFQNKSSDADAEYLSDGMAETLIYRLSQLPNLKVSPTSSVIRYKGKETDVKMIAGELGVSSVMTGRILQRGQDLTISVELVDVRNDKVLWAEQYDRKMSDLLATQREIAAAIAQKLQLKLAGNETKGITKRYTNSNEAYQLYLKGRYHFAKRTKADMQQSIEYYQQAVQLDPNFALAYARIAEVYNQLPVYPFLAPNEAIPRAKASARRALEIDPTLAEAHTALANSLVIYDWSWAEAGRVFRRAIELDPNSSAAHLRYGLIYLSSVGRHDEALVELNRAFEIEPLDLVMGVALSYNYFVAKKNDLALEQALKTYNLEPNFALARWGLGRAYIRKEMYAEAIALSEKSLQADSTNQLMLQVIGYSFAKSGRRQEAKEVIKRFKEIAKTQYMVAYHVATIYAALGDSNKAFDELEKSFEQHDWFLHQLKVDPFIDPVRLDPRFKEMLKRIGLPE